MTLDVLRPNLAIIKTIKTMKQLKLYLFSVAALCFLQTKTHAQFQQPLSPEGIFDTIYDKDGAKYLLSDMEIASFYSPYSDKSIMATCNSGYFNLYFETGSLGAGTPTQQSNNQAVICKVFQDISNFISSPLTVGGNTTTVNILIHYDPAMASDNLGYATQFYTMPAGTSTIFGGIVDGEVYKTIISGIDGYTNYAPVLYNVGVNATAPNGGYFHGMVAFNFYTMNPSYLWNVNMGTTSLTSSQFDLYSVALHEATHALGFASLIGSNGLSKMSGSGFSNYYSRYDKFLQDYNNVFLLKQTGSTCGGNYNYAFNTSATSTSVLATGTCSQSVIFAGTANQKVYTPTTYTAGSSISHFDDNCHAPTFTVGGNVMHPVTYTATTRRFFQPEERKVLCDLGYSVTASFGSSVAVNTTTYSGGACTGLGIGGVNDGFSAGGYIWTAPQNTAVAIPTVSILANDYNATQVSCPELIFGQGAVTVSGANLVFTPTSTYMGPFVIRYVPYNGTNYGNITYIFGFIVPGGCNPVSPCDIVQNGGFESITGSYQCGDGYSGSNINLNCWFKHALTPDLFGRGCTNNASTSTAFNNGAYNLGTNTFSSSPVWNSPPTLNPSNNHVLGFIEGSQTLTRVAESMQNYLSSPLVNGQAYQISFWCYSYSGVLKFPYDLTTVTYSVNPDANNNVISFATSSLTTLSPQTGNYWSSSSSSLTPVMSYTTSSVNKWVYVSTTFTYSGSNGNVLVLGGDIIKNIALGSTPTSTVTYWHYNLIDDISILPVNVAPVLSIPQTTYCPSSPTVTNLAQYATPVDPSSSFSGPGVSLVGGQYNFNPAIAGAGTHAISYTYVDGLGCSHTAYQQLTVKPTFTITPTSQFIYAGQSATITASGSTGTYSWMPGSLTGSVVVVTPTATTVYTVTNAASGTCTANNTSTVTVSAACSQSATASYTNYTIPSGTYTAAGTVIDLAGTITIAGNTSLTGYTLRMAPGSKILITFPSILTLDNCKLFGCTELWQGIELETLRSSAIYVKNGTTIEDMYAGIYAIRTSTQTSVAGIINVENSKLNKNYVSIQLNSVTGSTLSGVAYSLTVKNSTITTESSLTSPGNNLKPSTTYTYAYNQIAGGAGGSTAPYTNFPRGLAGIYLNNLSATNPVVIGDSAGSLNTYNRFSNLDFGIYATNAQLRVHNNYFFNMMGSTKRTYFDVNNPVTVVGPDEIGIAIVAQHTVANTYSLQVGTKNSTASSVVAACPKANAFKTVNKAISAKNCKTVIAKGNLFDADATTDVLDVAGGGITPTSDSYLYNQSQSAIWVSGLSKNAGLNYNYIKNYNAAIYAAFTMSVSSGAYLHVNSNNIQSQQAAGFCTQAINIEQVGGANIGTDLLEIANNSITKVYRGIYIKSVLEGVYLHDNANITIDNVKILGKGAGAASFVHHGINMLSTQKAKVFYNTNINSITTSAFTATNYSLTSACYLQNSPSCTVTCNTVNNVGRGFSYVGNNTSPNGWLGNAMSNSYNGYELRTNGVIGAQGSSPGGTLAANTWSNVTQETYVLSSPTSNTVSYMYVAANTGSPKTSPTLNFGTAGQTYSVGISLGIREVTGTPFSCGGGGGGFEGLMAGMSSSEEETSDNIVYKSLSGNSSSYYEVYPEEFIFQNQQMVYRLQKEGVVSNSADPVLQSFYTDNQTSNIGKFVDVADDIANGQSALAMSKNNSINPATAVQQKTKRVNELMLKLNADANYTFSNTELQDLYTIAGECSVKGWYVVQARNILNVISGQILYYEDNCVDEKIKSRMANTEETQVIFTEPANEFLLYPNPNNGQMELHYTIHNKQAAQLVIMDVTGRIISHYELPENSSNLHINELELKSGVYFYTIKQNNSVLKQAKFVIMK